MLDYHLPLRLKRLRKTPAVRALVQETHLHSSQFIAPIFISEKISSKEEIKSLPGYFKFSLADLPSEIDLLSSLGIPAILLFGIPAQKDSLGSSSLQDSGIVQQAIKTIRSINPNMLIIADVCLCEYTDHGHCGALCEDRIDNDKTLSLLGQQAVSYAKAGADWVAPSSMTDGMVTAIRQALDEASCFDTAILSYTAKYASTFYGPFRDAGESPRNLVIERVIKWTQPMPKKHSGKQHSMFRKGRICLWSSRQWFIWM